MREGIKTDGRKDLLKMIPNKNSLTKKNVVIMLTVLAGMVLVVLYASYVNVSEVKKHLQENLADVAKQNALMLETKIGTEYELLDSLSGELEDATPQNIEEKLHHFEIFLDNFNLKRFAYCFPDGTTYSTDGEVTDLAYREFYQAGMDGRSFITGVLSDAIQKDATAVNVITKPVYDKDGNINGVFGLAYDTENFNDFLQLESFDGYGYSCIINENFEIMAATKDSGLELSNNIIDDLLQADTRNKQSVEELSDMVKNKQEGSGILYLSGKTYYYSVPVVLMDDAVSWHAFTIIPYEVLHQRTAVVLRNQFITITLVTLLVLIGARVVIKLIKEHHNKIICFAYEDPVTGGDNYTKFCIEMEKRQDHTGYLVAMDIANFNYISVVAGEGAGDEMIKETWNIIKNALHRDELAGHIRDEMFILFLKETQQEKLLERMAKISGQIRDKAKAFQVHGIRAGYGICPVTEKELLENLYSKARIAKEYAIADPESEYAFYNDVDGVKVQYEKQLEELFPEAIEKEEFEVWYQPKYDAKHCRIVGSEALVRWRRADGEMVSPGKFIPLFERNGMITKLDEYMFRAVCKQQKRWLDEGKTVYPVSVNISRASLYCMDVEKHYYSIMKEYNILPEYIQLEVTETVMEAKKEILELLNRFRQMGIKILMDDFGTGYSSLAALGTQCFDTLKLDKTLIDHIGDRDGETILYHVIRMGQQMGLHITAEGVERKNQLEFLQNLNCDDIQGFYFAKPMPAHEYEKKLLQQGMVCSA